MHNSIVVLIGGSGALTLLVVANFLLVHRRMRRKSDLAIAEPRSLVVMLTSKDEVVDAALRAAAFEREIEASARTRASRLEALAAGSESKNATVLEIHPRSA